jgi:hypothetical protein
MRCLVRGWSASALALVPTERSQQFGTLAGNSMAEKHMPFRVLASSHRSALAHQANHSVKRDGLSAAPYLKR